MRTTSGFSESLRYNPGNTFLEGSVEALHRFSCRLMSLVSLDTRGMSSTGFFVCSRQRNVASLGCDLQRNRRVTIGVPILSGIVASLASTDQSQCWDNWCLYPGGSGVNNDLSSSSRVLTSYRQSSRVPHLTDRSPWGWRESSIISEAMDDDANKEMTFLAGQVQKLRGGSNRIRAEHSSFSVSESTCKFARALRL